MPSGSGVGGDGCEENQPSVLRFREFIWMGLSVACFLLIVFVVLVDDSSNRKAGWVVPLVVASLLVALLGAFCRPEGGEPGSSVEPYALMAIAGMLFLSSIVLAVLQRAELWVIPAALWAGAALVAISIYGRPFWKRKNLAAVATRSWPWSRRREERVAPEGDAAGPRLPMLFMSASPA